MTTILLSSAGRRPYLVEWFADALHLNGVEGRILVVDADPHVAARNHADLFIVAPRVVDDAYEEWLASLLVEQQVDLAVSLNDFELSKWAQLPPDFPGVERLLRLDAATQGVIEDKVRMAETMQEHGVTVPVTRTARQALEAGVGPASADFVTKGRFGSGSRGLRFAAAADLRDTIADAAREVTGPLGEQLSSDDDRYTDYLVVQNRVVGDEYGLDVVSDLSGAYAAVLARRKISMRGGETDQAVSADASLFDELGRALAEAVPHPGTMDVDVIVDAEGVAWVIDINPRFGGGYPFSHLAGAHTPAAYIAWLSGRAVDPTWFAPEANVISSKYVGVARTS